MLKTKKFMAALVAFAISIPTAAIVAPPVAAAPVGSGFTVTASDLAYILKQIKISESHAATLTPSNPCGTLVATPGDGIPDANQIPDRLTSYGLRTVDGSCNNLFQGRENFAAADVPFPRLTDPVFRDAEPVTAGFPVGPLGPTSYKQKQGSVVDSEPRVISNLIVDQTSTNPAAIAAAQFPVRTQGNTGVAACTVDPTPADPNGTPDDCVPSHQTLFIPNVTTDVGLSPPYNSWFTFFGQFFDHGVDQTVKGGGTVFVPLKADDPLRTVGPDGIAGNGDEVPAGQAFMVLTRAQNQPGPDGVLGTADDIQDANNTDSPWVDQSQTYSSHASHQVFLREYAMNAGNRPVSTGKLLGGLPAGQTYPGSPDGTDGIGTWAAVKRQAATRLGLLLQDRDVTNIPALLTDPYGKFVPGPNGLPQYLRTDGTTLEGNLANPVPVPANAVHFDTPFLTDIAHNADPSPQDTDNNPATPPVAPVADADTAPSADFASQPAGTYDNEMLDAHFSCGDGRCNENIALSAVHQIFHSEHDRLVDDIKGTLSAQPASVLAEWQSATGAAGWNGERLFQAARFVTEMEYQHLVFEEFGRKVQPAIRPFHVYSPDINPAVQAEFAHAVYRFGHSMLDDDVARTNTNGSDNSVPLLTAFLNPPEYFNGGTVGTLTPRQAAGSVIMGSVDQVGNELDEFVTETLRNNLLGLPLDLPTLNMVRARDAGVPPLNEVRRQIHAQTNDGQLAPYTSWTDFGQNIKHPESLINFVAAYGLHPSITGATTAAAKRDAARAIVNPLPTDVAPADAAEFMFGTGAWANGPGGVTTTGLDNVDLWVGGLAEITNLFGGLLGSTFNYVFQTQMEDLQDGDRFYYLNRTPGMNLRTQLEGNSFAEMIERNTDGTTGLKADVFATADCKFTIGNQVTPAPAGSFITGTGSIADDPATTDCDENRLLLAKPDGTIQYRQVNSVDPVGINGQSVYQGDAGTNKVDRMWGGNDNDTFWGGLGNDVIEGNGGDDVALGGDGNDIITDLSGADVQKGGPGNDALDGGIGDDIFMGGDGQDFINGGQNDNETFAGPGNDFVIAGAGADAVFGDGGDDWIQGGSGQDLLIGDHGAPFFDDPAQAAPGNDVFIGQVGENDYDAEGGDDLMSQNAAVDRNAGAGGFDWAFHQYDTVGADDDMAINNNLVGVPIQVVVNRDRWQETEADSGSAFNDVIRGTDDVPAALGGAGFTGCNALDPAGVARISGLGALVTTFPSPLAPIVANSAAGYCPLVGAGATATDPGTVWGEGEILLGGAGSDTITGRGADDIIDGDRALSVRISVRDSGGAEIGSTDLMEGKAKTGTFGAGTTNMTLQQAVFAGLVDPGNLVVVREIITPANGAAVDTAVFAGPQANYTIAPAPGGKVVVTQTGANVVGQKVSDGVDTLSNIERLAFSDGTVTVAPPAAPVIGTATATNGSATVTFTPPAGTLTGFTIEAVPTAGGTTVTSLVTDGTATSGTVNGLTNGTAYRLRVAATNAFGTGAFSALSNTVTPVAPTPAATLTPTTGRAFATTNVGATTAGQLITLTNSGTGALTISSRTLAGTNPGDFVLGATTCGATLAAGASCTTSISFRPTAAGARSATFVVADNATGSPRSVPLTGTGVAVVNAAPTVTAVTPVNNATGQAVTVSPTATFSEAITGFSTATATIRVGTAAAGTLVPAAVTFNAATRVLTINPTANLLPDTRYTVRLIGGAAAIRDLAGAPLVSTSWTFLTGPAPTVTAQSPAANATGVAVANNITATFSEAITGFNTTTATVRVGTAANGTLVPAAVTFNATTRVLTINPNANLANDTRYTVRLAGGATAIRDAAGNPLASTSWTFLTGPAPAVTARTPAVNATGVSRTANITSTFSEAMQAATMTGANATFRLGTATTGTPIAAVVSYNATTRVLTINPNATLAANTQYTVRLATGIRDAAGNPLPTTIWTFRTGA